MSSTPILSSLVGLLNALITTYVNTGNRTIDTTIIGFLVLTSGIIVNGFYNNKALRNRIRALWHRPKSPIDFKDNHYEMHTFDEIKNMKNTTVRLSQYRIDEIIRIITTIHQPLLHEGNHCIVDVKDPEEMINRFMFPFFMKNGVIVYATYKSGFLQFISENSTIISESLQFVRELIPESSPVEGTPDVKKPMELITTKVFDSNLLFNKTGVLNPHRVFDTLYYDQKTELFDLLTRFKEERMYPPALSLDNKLGIMLYGPPGTGKTGTITAIANFLQRPVLSVNLAEVILAGKLPEILKADIYKKYVIVLDEVDHMIHLCTDTLKKEKHSEVPEQKPDWASLLAVAEGEERKKVLDLIKTSMTKEKARSQFDFATFLQLMDGLEDATGRLMIFCTNNPEELERTYPALFRPGRIDIRLCLGYCSTQMFVDLLGAALSLDEKGRKLVRDEGLPTGRWTPLQVINMALLHKTLDCTIKALRV
jgi:hypothetical protein